MAFAVVIIIMSVIRGIYAILAKNVQKDFAGNFAQDVYFTMVFFLLQFIFLWALPPYRLPHIEAAQLFNPAMFGILSLIGTVLFFNAMRIGPTALTNIINNFSMLVPIMLGLFFWNEHISLLQIAGIAFVFAALFLFNAKAKTTSAQPELNEKKEPFKWLLTAVAAAAVTGFAVFFTKRNSIQYPEYFKEYLLILCAVTALAALPYVMWAAAKNKIRLIPDIKFLYLTAILAIIQDIYNIFYTIFVGQFDSALFFPIAGVCAMLAVVLGSRIFLKEKLSPQANAGILLSIIAITLLSI